MICTIVDLCIGILSVCELKIIESRRIDRRLLYHQSRRLRKLPSIPHCRHLTRISLQPSHEGSNHLIHTLFDPTHSGLWINTQLSLRHLLPTQPSTRRLQIAHLLLVLQVPQPSTTNTSSSLRSRPASIGINPVTLCLMSRFGVSRFQG